MKFFWIQETHEVFAANSIQEAEQYLIDLCGGEVFEEGESCTSENEGILWGEIPEDTLWKVDEETAEYYNITQEQITFKEMLTLTKVEAPEQILTAYV